MVKNKKNKRVINASEEVIQQRLLTGEIMETKRGVSTMKLYVAAITDLYQQQVALGMNTNPHVRKNKVISDLVKSISTMENARNLKSFKDRGRDGPNDGTKGILMFDLFNK